MEIVLLVETYWTWTPNSNFIAISMAKIVFPRSLQNRKTLNVGVSLYARSRPNYNRAARFEDNFSRALFHQLIREWFTSFNKKKKKSIRPTSRWRRTYILRSLVDLRPSFSPLSLACSFIKERYANERQNKSKEGRNGKPDGLIKIPIGGNRGWPPANSSK